MAPLERLQLSLRVLTEVGVVGGLGWWGVHAGDAVGTKILLGVGAPVVGLGLWGAVDFRQTGRFAEALRLAEELFISGLAAVALCIAGQPVAGIALAALSILYHAIVYASGARLLVGSSHPDRARSGASPRGAEASTDGG